MVNEHKFFLVLGGLFAFLAVAAGAFGAHILKEKLSPTSLNAFEIGVKYQFYHAFGLIAAALILTFIPSISMRIAAVLFIVGTVVFSGSLYMLALTGVKLWGAITPIGGLLLLAAWAAFILGVVIG